MDKAPEIKDIDRDLLTSPVLAAIGSSTAEVRRWEHEPISYINTEDANLGVHRFRGMAEDRGEIRPWSIMLKAVRAPLETDQHLWNYHRREIFAYQSGLLENLPGAFCAPRCLEIMEYADDVCWLWLEDVSDSVKLSWSLREYGMAARHLGRFNGAYLTGHPLPDFPWLSQNWVQGWLARYEKGCLETLDLMRQEGFWEHPLLKSNFPQPITDDFLRLWYRHPALLKTLSQLPQTFCHMDAYRPNLFLRRDGQGNDQTVAIDWVFAGTGGVGEEIANLLAASLFWFEYEAADVKRLDEEVFSGYVAGLREAGWEGDYQLARLGYSTACALRWGVVGLWWLFAINDSQEQADFETNWRRPLPELVSQWAKIAYYVLKLAEEAYVLQHKLF